MTFCRVVGTISSSGFDSGDQFVVGCWVESPVGPISDVMWRDPSGRRTLLASSPDAAEFITSIYRFDSVEVVAMEASSRGGHTSVSTPRLELEIRGGRRRPIPIARPLWVTRRVEGPIARRLMKVETYGVSPTGAREWYRTRGWRWAVEANAELDGRSLGAMAEVTEPMGVGFSNPPVRPSVVDVVVTIELP